ncbi:serine/threonine-protein kinase [Thermoactinospora rubra]|uniref:serine/threonine-protein kinase n=1 Tax=Thermoactinospora rubra TaxID=1088767 RepID=UPI000A121E86|nr:serine/threonine-protein kinase [Thermoactinospora rubra]
MPHIAPLAGSDPRQLGSFRLTGRIGEGGQGVVYLGENEQGEKAAIKLLHIKFSGDSIARSRFARELKAAQRVASFCTARVLEADLEGDTPYIASEYIEGRSLREIVDTDGPLRGTALDRLAIGTATALTAIHHASIVHRDFKPDNVLIAADGPRVVDFGIARIIDSTGTITSRAIGTPAYMAPEQISGDEVGPYTDVFAWGATIAFAATGKTVFEGTSIAVVLNRILNHEVDVSVMHEPLRGTVQAALSKEPDRRPTADQILLRLLGQPDSAGASTALLSQGAELAGDDTSPIPRQRVTVAGRTGQQPSGPLTQPAVHHGQPGAGQSGITQQGAGEPGGGQQGVSQTLQAAPGRAQAPSSGSSGPVRAPSGPFQAPPAPPAPPAEPPRRRTGPWIGLGLAVVLIVAAVAALAWRGVLPLPWGADPSVDPTPEESPGTFTSLVDKVAKTGKIVIGVKGDLPNIGLESPANRFTGFEVELGRRIARGLGADPDGITFVRVYRDTRDDVLINGEVDLVLATYTMDDGDVQFAGPYYLAHQDVLVREGEGIEKLADLAGKSLCAPQSPSVGNVQRRVPEVKLVRASDYGECMNMLSAGTVDAIPGEDLILAGFAQRALALHRVLGAKLTNERYAVGIKKGDVRACKAVTGILAELWRDRTMAKLLKQYFGKVSFKPELKQPAAAACG